MGKNILLITPFHKSQRGNNLTARRLKYGLRHKGFSVDILSLEQAAWEKKLTRYMQEGRYDLIHGFHALHFSRALRAVPELMTLPLVLTMTGTDINYSLKGEDRSLMISTLNAVDQIVIFNQDFASIITSPLPGVKDKLKVIPQGVFLGRSSTKITREQLGIKSNDVVFLLPSGLRPVKNIELALDAMQDLYDELGNVRLIIIGAELDPEYVMNIKNRIAHLDWVTYLGEIPHFKIRRFMETADVVLNTSCAEGQPQGALEAMYVGKPAILTAVPGNLNIIRHEEEGFYVKSRPELFQAARILASDPHLRKLMGKKARLLVKNNFSLQQELEAYSHLYDKILPKVVDF